MVNEIQRNILAIDLGGTALKGGFVDEAGKVVSGAVTVPTPKPATPDNVVHAIKCLAQPEVFQLVSVGFPGIVRKGITKSAPNLDGNWRDYPLKHVLERLFSKPVQVAKDADVHGLGVVGGTGVELVITLGTGLGSSLFTSGHLVPNFDLAHHPFHDAYTYEQLLGKIALARDGVEVWRNNVARAVCQLETTFNPDVIHIGGGNAMKLIADELSIKARIITNHAGLLGGALLWRTRSTELD